MRIGRRGVLGAGLSLIASRAAAQTPPPGSRAALPPTVVEPVETIDLWPGTAPGPPAVLPVEAVVDRSPDPLWPDRAVSGIARPRLVVFRPARALGNGAAVMIAPGGGYRRIVIDKEGYEMGRWLAARGFTAFVLFYRLPGEGWAAGPDVALADAQRAMRVIAARSRVYGIDPTRIAAMGFSAGGHVCADLSARFARPTYYPVDAADMLSARPAIAAPIYPVISMTPPDAHPGSRAALIGADASPAMERAHAPHLHIPEDAPPHFILHAEDDPVVPLANALLLRAGLKARNVAVETHLYAAGGHGFGLRGAVGRSVAAWPDLWLAWARSTGFIP